MPAKNNHSWKSKSLWPDIKAAMVPNKPIIVYDLETTGLSSKNDRIIEIAAIKYWVDEGLQMHEVDVYHQYINPGRPLPEVITELTGITDEMLSDKPAEGQVYADIKEFFGNCTVSGYNIENFDNKFMAELYGRMGDFFTPKGTVDCIKMARNRLVKISGTPPVGDVGNYKLATIGAFFHLDFTAHSAIEDARTTGKLTQLFVNEYLAEAAQPVEPAPSGTLQPTIKTVSFWPGFKGFSRIYVNTNMGSVYYDIRGQVWGGKDLDIANVDMDYLEKEVFRLTGSANESEFSKFKETINV